MYKEMVELARATGFASEKLMEDNIDAVDDLLDEIKKCCPKSYWNFIRRTHEMMFGKHYDSQFADLDVARLHYTDKDGNVVEGEHWTREQVTMAFSGKTFSQGVTECDKYVAANVMYSDLCRKFTDEQIIDATYLFFFNDEDWPNNGKIWDYMKH